LQRHHPDGTANPTADPAALARLRRISDPTEAAMDEAVFALFRKLYPDMAPENPRFEGALARVGVLASVLAHVREQPSPDRRGRRPSAASAIGRRDREKPESVVMSALRFRRLLTAKTDADILIGFRRLVALAGGKINVADVADSILIWGDPDRGDRVRTRWAFDYYGGGHAVPRAAGTEPTQQGVAES
jgi:CRISPR system Cascade subunit CasB